MLQDAKENKEQLALLETLFQNAPVGFSFVDREFRFIHINHVLAEIDGRSVTDYLGKTVQELVPSLWPTLEPLFQRALAGETILNYDVSGRAIAESQQVCHWLVSYFPIRHGNEITGIGGIVNDITDQKNAEANLHVRNDMYAMLSQTHRAVSECQSDIALFKNLCRIAVEIGGFQFAWVGVPDGNRIRMVTSAGRDEGYLSEIVVSLDENDIRSHGPTGRAAISGNAVVVNDLLASKITAPWHEIAKKVGIAASAAFPLRERGNVIAVFNLYAATRGFFTDEMVATLNEIVPSVSFGLDKLAQDRDRVRDEVELRLRDRAMKAVSQGIIITDPQRQDNPIIYVNAGFEQMTGYSVDEVLGINCRFLQGELSDRTSLAQLRNAIRDGHGCTVELRNYRKDGTVFWNNLTISAVYDKSGQLTHFIGINQDVTERKTVEEELRASEVRLKALSRELIETREKELRHLARELHDEIGQMLTAMKMNLRGIQRSCESDYSRRLDENIALIDQTVQLVRNLALNMRPPHLEHLGLVPTLQWYLKSQSTIAGIQAHLNVFPAEIDISTDLAIVCFRIIQEAVTNAIRHAAPNRIDVELRQDQDELQLHVVDDGKGFDVGTALLCASRGASLGLISMQERASLVGGRVEFESTPGKQTSIHAWFPRSHS